MLCNKARFLAWVMCFTKLMIVGEEDEFREYVEERVMGVIYKIEVWISGAFLGCKSHFRNYQGK